LQILIDESLQERFPGLDVVPLRIEKVKILKENINLEKTKLQLYEEIKSSHTLESVRDEPVFQAYRDFYWRVGVDPTKTRPAGEALLRRILGGKPLPSINTLVDSYNLVSAKTGIAIGAWNFQDLKGSLRMRVSSPGEKFLGIGMASEATLSGKDVVVQDEEKLVAIYPYRDAEKAKVTLDTKDVLFFMCGVPGISTEELKRCAEETSKMVKAFNGGSLATL
jgi:DNA/RNA-binding domain of Phe-tRNA-synthetase-like protein